MPQALPSADVLRFPPRPRAAPPASALDALLAGGAIDDRQHAAGLAYRRLRRRYEVAAASYRVRQAQLTDAQRDVVKRRHAILLRAASAERFMLDRLCLDGGPPLAREVERVRAALARTAGSTETPVRSSAVLTRGDRCVACRVGDPSTPAYQGVSS